MNYWRSTVNLMFRSDYNGLVFAWQLYYCKWLKVTCLARDCLESAWGDGWKCIIITHEVHFVSGCVSFGLTLVLPPLVCLSSLKESKHDRSFNMCTRFCHTECTPGQPWRRTSHPYVTTLAGTPVICDSAYIFCNDVKMTTRLLCCSYKVTV